MRSPRLRLVNNDGTVRYDLMYGLLSLYNWRWTTATSTPRMRSTSVPFGGRSVFESYAMMTESLDLASRSRCADDIREAQARIEDFLVEARKHGADPVHGDPRWLEWGARGEVPRRTLVYGGQWQFLNQPRVTPLLEEQMSIIRLVLSRHPFWEEVSANTASTNGVSCIGGIWNFGQAAGREPARMSIAEFSAPAAQTNALTKLWCGFRPAYDGFAAFDSVWECESTGVGGGNASFHAVDVVDISSLGSPAAPPAHNDWYAMCDFSSDTALLPRVGMTVEDVVGGNYEDFKGRYLVLLRARATGDVGIQMRAGYSYSGEARPREEVSLDATNYPFWELIELGEVQFPPEGEWEGTDADHLRRAGIGIFAEQIDAGAQLDMDCVILIPSEHFVYVGDANIVYHAGSPGATNPLKVVTKPDDTIVAVQYQIGYPYQSRVAEPELWYIPVLGDTMMVLAAQRDGSHNLNDTLDIDLTYYPRWLSYRDTQ